ncbi:MAG: tetratricopeptide repeat protein [Verrucomicrobiota bacterium]
MRHRLAKTLFFPTACLALPASLLGTGSVVAQAGPTPVAPANFDPSDVYFQGYLLSRSAEELEKSGDFVGAAEKLKKARELFDAVQRYYPAWKSEMVTGRNAQNSEAEVRIHPKAEEQRKKNKDVVAELEGGTRQSGTLIDPSEAVMPLTPGILEVNPLETKQLAEAEAEVKRLRELAKNDAESSRNLSRVNDLARQRDLAEAQLRAAENNLQALRKQLATSPAENELKSLNQRIAGLEQEKEAMGMALSQSRTQHTEALAKIATLQADLGVMQQKYSDLDRNLKSERKVANDVVAGQRTQLQAMEKELAQKNAELGKANERISGLIRELAESKDAFAQIRTERDSLLQERDQMSALLKLNEDGRIQDLIQQNMGLAKNLREANEKVERLNLDTNSTKDDVVIALQNLAIAKSQINKLHQEKREQDKRLEDLENRLRGEESSLANGKVASNPEEVAVLRDIIQRQLRVQERRRQARDLLVEAAKDLGSKDERLSQAINLFDGQEIQLTPDEQRLIAEKQVDGEFVSPFAQDRATVGKNTDQLNRDISVLERTAEKSYAAGRLLPTRELFEMIVEQHPGHIPTLCKLGVVDLKLKDPTAAVDKFRRAVELDSNNPYAHRMLGYSFYELNDLPAAELNLKQAVELAPDDAKSHYLLARTTYNLGRIGEAELHFKASISADPTPSEAYLALAILCSRDKRFDQARDYYNQALERGAIPNPSLEESLAKQ